MSDLALYRRLLRQARPYWLHLALLFCIGVLASPIALLNPVPLKIVVDSVIGTRPLPPAVRALLPETIAGSPGALLAHAGVASTATSRSSRARRSRSSRRRWAPSAS